MVRLRGSDKPNIRANLKSFPQFCFNNLQCVAQTLDQPLTHEFHVSTASAIVAALNAADVAGSPVASEAEELIQDLQTFLDDGKRQLVLGYLKNQYIDECLKCFV